MLRGPGRVVHRQRLCWSKMMATRAASVMAITHHARQALQHALPSLVACARPGIRIANVVDNRPLNFSTEPRLFRHWSAIALNPLRGAACGSDERMCIPGFLPVCWSAASWSCWAWTPSARRVYHPSGYASCRTHGGVTGKLGFVFLAVPHRVAVP